MEWVPAHVGLPGNEKADQIAKSAATMPFATLPPEPNSLLNSKSIIAGALKEAWQSSWTASNTGAALRVISPVIGKPLNMPDVPKHIEQSIHRFRTDTARVNVFEARIYPNTSPLCRHCLIPETRDHILRSCPAFAAARSSCLPNPVPDVDQLLREPLIRQTARFLMQIHRRF